MLSTFSLRILALAFLSTTALGVAIPTRNAAAELFKLKDRAGAPNPRSIANCTVTEVFPSNVVNPGYGFLPTSAFQSANGVYEYTLVYDTFYGDEETILENCLESCAGYGVEGDCKSVFLAYNVTDSSGNAPTQENFQCIQFGVDLSDLDFVAPTINGTYTYPKAANLACPTS